MRLLLLVVLGLTTQYLFAQHTITGQIKDKKTGETIPGATLIIKSTTLGTSTNSKGEYSIKGIKSGNYLIRINSFGYSTIEKEIGINSDLNINFELEPASIDLNAIVITGNRNEKIIGSSPVLTQLINGNAVQSHAINYLPELLNSSDASFEMMKDNTVRSLRMQGLGPQYIVFMVDGERMGGETKGAVDFSRINPANIERIEIVKGASSTLYGSNAIGGVVNIITRPVAQKFSATAGIQSNIYKDPATDKTKSDDYAFAGINFSQGKLSSFSDYKINFYDPYDLSSQKGVSGFLTQEKEKNYSINQKFTYRFNEKLDISAYGNFYQQNIDYFANGYPDKLSRNFVYGTKADYYLNKESKIQFSWHADHAKYYDVVDINHDLKNIDYDNLMNNIRVLGNFKIGNIQELTAGLEYLGEKQSSEQNNFNGKKKLDDLIAYVQDEISLTDNFIVDAGIRSDIHSIFGTHFSPQVNALYKAGYFNFRAAYGQGFRSPTAKELYTTKFKIPANGAPYTFYLDGNKDLNPETSNFYSASVQYTHSKIDFSIAYCNNDIKNLITSDSIVNMVMVSTPKGPMPSVIYYQYYNLGKANVQTINMLLKYNIATGFTVSGSYTYTNAENKITDQTLPLTRKHQARLNLDFNKKIDNYELGINLSGGYYGKKTVVDIYSRNQDLIKLNDYTLWKLTTVHHVGKHVALTLGADNIFDKTDTRPKYFNFASPGRSFIAGCKYEF